MFFVINRITPQGDRPQFVPQCRPVHDRASGIPHKIQGLQKCLLLWSLQRGQDCFAERGAMKRDKGSLTGTHRYPEWLRGFPFIQIQEAVLPQSGDMHRFSAFIHKRVRDGGCCRKELIIFTADGKQLLYTVGNPVSITGLVAHHIPGLDQRGKYTVQCRVGYTSSRNQIDMTGTGIRRQRLKCDDHPGR